MFEKCNLKKKCEYMFKPEFGINITRMFYSTGILFILFYIIFEHILIHFLPGSQVQQILTIPDVYKTNDFLTLVQGWYILILPALVLLLFFTALFFILKCHSSRKKLAPFVIKSYIITVIFGFITLKTVFLSGNMSKTILLFSDVPFAQVFGFMFIYAIPISVSVIVNHDDKEHFIRDVLIFFILIICANIPFLISEHFSAGSILFTIHEIGIFYFLAIIISLISIIDFIGADMDTGPASFLIYLGIPAYIVIVIMGFIIIILYMLISLLFNSKAAGFEIIAPFTQLYHFLKQLLYYKDFPGFIYSIVSLTAIAQTSLILYKKGTGDSIPDWDLSQIFRSFLGVAALSYFLSITFPFPWYIVTTVIFTGIIITSHVVIGRKVFS